MYDLVSICLLAACIFTHFADISNHSEAIARTHIRLMAFTIIFISLKIIQVGCIINQVNTYRLVS